MNTQMVNFMIPKKLLLKVDKEARSDSRTRSEIIRGALRFYLGNEEARRGSFEIMRASARRVNMSEEEAIAYVDAIRDTLPMNQPPKKRKKK